MTRCTNVWQKIASLGRWRQGATPLSAISCQPIRRAVGPSQMKRGCRQYGFSAVCTVWLARPNVPNTALLKGMPSVATLVKKLKAQAAAKAAQLVMLSSAWRQKTAANSPQATALLLTASVNDLWAMCQATQCRPPPLKRPCMHESP